MDLIIINLNRTLHLVQVRHLIIGILCNVYELNLSVALDEELQISYECKEFLLDECYGIMTKTWVIYLSSGRLPQLRSEEDFEHCSVIPTEFHLYKKSSKTQLMRQPSR